MENGTFTSPFLIVYKFRLRPLVSIEECLFMYLTYLDYCNVICTSV